MLIGCIFVLPDGGGLFGQSGWPQVFKRLQKKMPAFAGHLQTKSGTFKNLAYLNYFLLA